ncbi:MAG TPA: prenyltransferase, partial [Mycobacteriales bacterium]|nr:prenyltransferase [Mycobacteriales bacterium]
RGLVVGFYVAVVACVLVGALPWPALACLGALPMMARTVRHLREPRPAEPPPGFPVWPLWFAAICFVHTRRAGGLLVLGLVAAAVAGIRPGAL